MERYPESGTDAQRNASPRLECASCSDIGRVRVRNEDVLWAEPQHGWLVLSDGMGGYRGGDIAARLAVERIERRLCDEGRDCDRRERLLDLLLAAVDDANAEIRRAGVMRPELSGMGATVVVAAFLGAEMICAHVGDSRLYRLRDGVLERLTRDHSLLQEQIDAGMIHPGDIRGERLRGLLTRGLGVDLLVEPDIAVHEVCADDLYLLCSDGLTDMVDDAEIAAELGGGGDLPEIARRLVALANDYGGRDNVSVIVARPAA